LTRLFSLREAVRNRATTLPGNIDTWDQDIDTFFENLWKPVYIQLMGADRRVAEQWHYIIRLHQRAYDANDFQLIPNNTSAEGSTLL